MARKLFKEQQRFKNIEVFFLIGFLMIGLVYRLIQAILRPGQDYIFTILLASALIFIFGVLIYGLTRIRLKISISEKCLKYKLVPLHRTYQKIKFKNIQSCKIIRTPLLAQWHGWNISFKKEKNYSIGGRNGIQITTKDGNVYFIGTRNVEELEQVIKQVVAK